MDTAEKTRENRLRRMARRRGLRLQKSRRRDTGAVDYGTYQLIDTGSNSVVSHGGGPLSLNEAECQLQGWMAFHRAEFGEHVDAEAGSVITIKPGAVIDMAIGGRRFIADPDGALRAMEGDDLADETPDGLA